jgi:hypothetical protein
MRHLCRLAEKKPAGLISQDCQRFFSPRALVLRVQLRPNFKVLNAMSANTPAETQQLTATERAERQRAVVQALGPGAAR